MDEELYPAPKIKWYAAAQEHPSLFMDCSPAGLERPVAREGSCGSTRDTGGQRASNTGDLTVFLARAGGLKVQGSGASYYATAYYQGEAQEVIDSRQTRLHEARRSSATSSVEACELGERILVPFNSRQQFVRVALYRVDLQGDSLAGEAIVPLADPAAESDAAWPLLRDFEDRGEVTLRLRLPGSEPEPQAASLAASPAGAAEAGEASMPLQPRTLPFATQAASCAPTRHGGYVSEVPGSCSSPATLAEHGSLRLGVGSEVEVFSKTASRWLPGTVTSLETNSVTVDYGERRRIINLASSDASQYLRPLSRVEAQGSERRPELPSPEPTAPQQQPGASSVSGFARGDRIEVWSNTAGAWLDGIVQEVFATACKADGYAVPAGTVRVRSAAGVKWVMAEQIDATLR
eukprot:TRINITY_DN3924_c0_g1_i1.p1 TRINITY_DN3924_c0_g1~~TRINITY_DN3924_c0_g1_i1.p1  ORF type:complete len:406 (+),score=95.57 TRINITY_DN3924_c0_g1_i1:122-1339(+)